MKTFFEIQIKANGEIREFKVQSTKLKKLDQTKLQGIYTPKLTLSVSCYEIDLFLYLTHRVELCGTCGKPVKQKRYTLHSYNHEVYLKTHDNMLMNVYSEIASVVVTIKEQGALEDGVTINENIK